MHREIREIPAVAASLVEASGERLAARGRRLREADPALVVTVARGSSDHAATYLKYAIEIVTGVPVASLGPSIASVYAAPLKLANAACFAISQSGKSPDIVAMAEATRRGGAFAFALTNTPASPLAKACDETIDIAAGPERSVAATKSFVNSVIAGLAMLAHWSGNEALLAALGLLPSRFAEAVDCDWSPLADAIDGHDSVFVLGRGPATAIANETALKFKETCSIHAEAYSTAEVMHGPVSLVDRGFPVLVLAARDAAESGSAKTADVLAAKGASVFATSAAVRAATALPFVETGHPLTDPLALIVSFYAFIEAYARRRGLDPDRPAHLSKVTETR